MRIRIFLGLTASIAFGACSTSTTASSDGALQVDSGPTDIGLSFDSAKFDTGAGAPDTGAGTDAQSPADAEAPDVPGVADVADVPVIVDVLVTADVPPPEDIQPDIPATPDVPVTPDVPTTPDAGNAPDVAEPDCPSGLKWIFGSLFGSDLMEPGLACIDCHTKKGPTFTIAGTVYPGFHTVDTCDGTASITVEITGSDGKVQTLATNSVGNFHGNSAVAMPFTARVIDGTGKDRKMFSAQSTGDCNTCHTASGANGAPGRIHAP